MTALASGGLALGQDCRRRHEERFAPAMRAGIAITAKRRVLEGCREVQLADGAHYPVLLSIEQIPAGVALPEGGVIERVGGG